MSAIKREFFEEINAEAHERQFLGLDACDCEYESGFLDDESITNAQESGLSDEIPF